MSERPALNANDVSILRKAGAILHFEDSNTPVTVELPGHTPRETIDTIKTVMDKFMWLVHDGTQQEHDKEQFHFTKSASFFND